MTPELEKPTIQTIRQKIVDFGNAQSALRAYGASDTEPDSIFQKLLNDIAKGAAPKIPRTADEWELYTTLAGSDFAAKKLCLIATELAIEIENLPLRHQKELEKIVRDTCWRMY